MLSHLLAILVVNPQVVPLIVTMEKKVFATNLRRILDSSEMTRREVAEQIGVKYKTLCRWMTEGVTKPDHRTRSKLVALCRLFDVALNGLWVQHVSKADDSAEKIRATVVIWERVGIRFDWIDSLHTAARVVDRFRREEPELCQRLKRLERITTDAQFHAKFEPLVKDWIGAEKLTEADSYRKLMVIASQLHDE
jgi:transcriptional regulator with XRE-family HTH domain